jgi:two-component system, chemotaxis family, CheB/CheR fusion protein
MHRMGVWASQKRPSLNSFPYYVRRSVRLAHSGPARSSCRNLLIYLNHQAQERVLDLFHFALKAEGLLFLGSSESIDNERPLFRILDKKHRLYTRLAVNRQALPMFNRPSSLIRAVELGRRLHASMLQRPMTAPQIQQDRSASLTELHFKLLEEFSPGSVLIDKDDNIVHLSERAERYLHLGGGEVTLNLLRVVHPNAAH